MPHKLINKIYSELPKDFTKHVDNGVEWQFEIHVASMIGTAEHMDKVLDIASNMKQQKIGIIQFVLRIYLIFLKIKVHYVILISILKQHFYHYQRWETLS